MSPAKCVPGPPGRLFCAGKAGADKARGLAEARGRRSRSPEENDVRTGEYLTRQYPSGEQA